MSIASSESVRFIDESSSSSPRSSKVVERSRPSTAKSRRSSLSKSAGKRATFSNETSEERNSEDQSAIVAVIESSEWGEEEDEEIDNEIRKAIEKDGQRDTELDDDDGVGILRVLPSTSEEETPRNLGLRISRKSDTDFLPQVRNSHFYKFVKIENLKDNSSSLEYL